MKRISIERYGNIPTDIPRPADVKLTPVQDLYAGLIEGETNDGRRWIMWLDKEGAPDLLWPERDADGGVVGEPIRLKR